MHCINHTNRSHWSKLVTRRRLQVTDVDYDKPFPLIGLKSENYYVTLWQDELMHGRITTVQPEMICTYERHLEISNNGGANIIQY